MKYKIGEVEVEGQIDIVQDEVMFETIAQFWTFMFQQLYLELESKNPRRSRITTLGYMFEAFFTSEFPAFNPVFNEEKYRNVLVAGMMAFRQALSNYCQQYPHLCGKLNAKFYCLASANIPPMTMCELLDYKLQEIGALGPMPVITMQPAMIAVPVPVVAAPVA